MGGVTATFKQGGTYNFTIAGAAQHGGGSCQASLSYDQGATFTVIKSYIGSCPLASNYDFTIPADAPAGDALFAWTWFNQQGNREMYMNCAHVSIKSSGASKRSVNIKGKLYGRDGAYKRSLSTKDKLKAKRNTTAFADRPAIFQANNGNGCKTVETTDLVFPDPGPDVEKNLAGTASAPTGTCASTGSSFSVSDSGSNTSNSTSDNGTGGSSATSSSDPATATTGDTGSNNATKTSVTLTPTAVGDITVVDAAGDLPSSTPARSSSSSSGKQCKRKRSVVKRKAAAAAVRKRRV
jgi:hypothetical protein